MNRRLTAAGFTLVEIMIVIAIIGIIVAIAVPAFLRAREVSWARSCQENLSKIDAAVDMYAIDNKKTSGDSVGMSDLILTNSTGYLKHTPTCPAGGSYSDTFVVNIEPDCSIGENTEAPFAPHILHVAVPATP